MTAITFSSQRSDLIFPSGIVQAVKAALAAGVDAFLLEGEPGTGKTAWGRELGSQVEARGGVFLFAQMHAWANNGT